MTPRLIFYKKQILLFTWSNTLLVGREFQLLKSTNFEFSRRRQTQFDSIHQETEVNFTISLVKSYAGTGNLSEFNTAKSSFAFSYGMYLVWSRYEVDLLTEKSFKKKRLSCLILCFKSFLFENQYFQFNSFNKCNK